MVPLVQRLVDLLNELRLGPRTFPDALRDLLRAIATQAIQDNPADATPPPGDWPGEALEAIEHGAAEAARLTAAGLQLHIEAEALPEGLPPGQPTDRPVRAFGPFVDRAGRLLRFTAFESPTLLPVVVRTFVRPDETVLWIPADSAPAPDDAHTWILPPGSVWIRSRFLVAGAADFAGVRVSSGTLTFTGATLREASRLVALDAAPWTLTVVPEPAEPRAKGSDAAALALSGPDRLIVHANSPVEVQGDFAVSGFGSDLHLSRAAASPTISDRLCRFPLAAAEASWTIDGNRSETMQLAGSAAIAAAEWGLPVSPLGPGAIAAAPHGGSLVLRLSGDVKSRCAGFTGEPFSALVMTLTLNGCRVAIDGVQVMPGGRCDVAVWPNATSSFVFAHAALRRLLFRSERDGEDAVAIVGGRQNNLWDLPRRADETAFPFAGDIEIFGLVRYADGHLVTSLASGEPPAGSSGLALENLYLVVRAPRRCALVGAFEPAAAATPAGLAYLFHDARCAVPMLPDPYAANITLIDHGDTFQEVLRLELSWIWSQRPSVVTHLEGDIRFTRPLAQAPEDDDERGVSSLFRGFLDAQLEPLLLLDVSSAEHLFGVALESPDNSPRPTIAGNRMALPLNRVRLFMQPQVHWEPVWIQPNPLVPALHEGYVRSQSHGGLTLVAARGDSLVPALPAPIAAEILQAIRDKRRAAALFSLPFGLRAMARLSPDDVAEQGVAPAAVDTALHEPDFGRARSARQIRVTARQSRPAIDDPERRMPGRLRQLKNLIQPNASGLESVLPHDEQEALNLSFSNSIPLHHADLSGYGLTSFSEWRRQGDVGVTKVHFEVMNGRTAFEVVEFRSALFECGARLVRTITIERRNSAAVVLTDTGWVPIEDGLFDKPVAFEKGAVKALRNIRRIRITGPSFDIGLGAAVEPVIFDAEAELEGLEGGGTSRTVTVLDRPGYVQVKPLQIGAPLLTPDQLKALFAKVGPISGPLDARIRLADALHLEVSSITSDFAADDGNGIGFAVAAVGNPELPRAGQWSVVRIDPATTEAYPVDPRRGVPVVRQGAKPFVFREPADARRTQPKVPYGLLMATQASRTLFPQPRLDPAVPRQIATEPALVADPYSLVQAGTSFPRAAYALRLSEAPRFAIAGATWRIEPSEFHFAPPAGDLLKTAEWALSRSYDAGGTTIRLAIDSAAAAPWALEVPPSSLDLDLPLPPLLQKILRIRTHYVAQSGGLPALATPTLEFAGALKEVKDIVDTLSKLADLGFNVDVDVTSSGSATNPSFAVQLRLIFRLGKPTERVDIGVGKFFGQFLIDGHLEVGASGLSKPRLFLEFQGDIQQGIIPPLLYAGGLFRFGIEIPSSGSPVISLAMGVVASIGGDLIPGLIEVEVTVNYGYTLLPQTLEPGVLLGLAARAKLLGGLVGFSFGVEAMARIKRVDDHGVRVWAHIRVAATVQIAILIEEDVDFETQFEQTIPLEVAALLPGGQLVGLAAAVARA